MCLFIHLGKSDFKLQYSEADFVNSDLNLQESMSGHVHDALEPLAALMQAITFSETASMARFS